MAITYKIRLLENGKISFECDDIETLFEPNEINQVKVYQFYLGDNLCQLEITKAKNVKEKNKEKSC